MTNGVSKMSKFSLFRLLELKLEDHLKMQTQMQSVTSGPLSDLMVLLMPPSPCSPDDECANHTK